MTSLKKLITLIVGVLLTHGFCQAAETRVLVSIAPYIEIAQKIGGKHIEVELVVPQGADSHNYEPTPKQIQQAAQSKLWFTLGETFEKKMQKALQSQNPALQICDLREGLPLLMETCGHHSHGYDPHIWMSPKLMILQAEHMGVCLEELLPDNKAEIQDNLKQLIYELEALDLKIHKQFDNKKGLVILVAHPAYGYFCAEYGITQIAIEHQGKDPSAKELTALIEEAKKLKIKKIFTQNQYTHKGAALLAEELGAKIVTLNPYSLNYFQMMLQIAEEFSSDTSSEPEESTS